MLRYFSFKITFLHNVHVPLSYTSYITLYFVSSLQITSHHAICNVIVAWASQVVVCRWVNSWVEFSFELRQEKTYVHMRKQRHTDRSAAH